MKYIELFRINQWIKNILLFAPLIITGSQDISKYTETSKNFLFFSLIVSGTYIINDLLDVESDRMHPIKKNRPIASGKISTLEGVFLSSVLIFIGMVFFLISSNDLILYPISYIILTIFYSFKLKYLKYFDLFAIIYLFTLRIFLGGEINQIQISPFLTIFIIFVSGAIVASKKISIYKSKNFGNSKVREFLLNSYNEKELNIILYVFSYVSLISYGVWVFYIKLNGAISPAIIFYSLSLLVLYILIRTFIELSKLALTEDIISLPSRNKKFFNLLIIFTIFYALGIVYETF